MAGFICSLTSTQHSKQRWQVVRYRKDALTTLAGLYQKQNRQDSFYYYSFEAGRLHDSFVKVVSLSNLRMAEIRSEVALLRMQVAMAAVQRMAALTLLNVNGREMAAVLGISNESMRKTRQRLRQRLQSDAQDDPGSSLTGLS